MALTNEQKQFIEFVAEIAIKDWRERRICIPSVVIAQAIKESFWGKSELAVNAKALFGIKDNGWTGALYYKVATEQNKDGSYVTTKDKIPWRKYNSWEESIIDHNTYIATRCVDLQQKTTNTPNYIKVVGETNYKRAIHALQTARYPYATSLTYETSIINNYIKKYDLEKYDKIALASTGTTTTTPVKNASTSFRVRVKEPLNIRNSAGGKVIKKNGCGIGVYTIIAVSGNWGKLRSGAGWISINPKYVDRL